MFLKSSLILLFSLSVKAYVFNPSSSSIVSGTSIPSPVITNGSVSGTALIDPILSGTMSGGMVSGTSMTITSGANNLIFRHPANTNRRATFDFSAITSGTLRTYSFVDGTHTIVMESATQTLTSKTVSGGTIHNPTISGTVITLKDNFVADATKGINFNATLNSSGTTVSEIFNDYENGTMVPEVSMTTVGASGTYTTQAGRYTKIGTLVSFDMVLAWTSLGAGTGNMIVIGVPYSPTAATACDTHADGLTLTASNSLQAYVTTGTPNRVVLEQMPVGGVSSTAVAKDNNVSALRIQCNYHTSSGL